MSRSAAAIPLLGQAALLHAPCIGSDSLHSTMACSILDSHGCKYPSSTSPFNPVGESAEADTGM